MDQQIVYVMSLSGFLTRSPRCGIELVSGTHLVLSLTLTDMYRRYLVPVYGLRLDNTIRWLANNNIRMTS